jgi:hypothetical protein
LGEIGVGCDGAVVSSGGEGSEVNNPFGMGDKAYCCRSMLYRGQKLLEGPSNTHLEGDFYGAPLQIA